MNPQILLWLDRGIRIVPVCVHVHVCVVCMCMHIKGGKTVKKLSGTACDVYTHAETGIKLPPIHVPATSSLNDHVQMSHSPQSGPYEVSESVGV